MQTSKQTNEQANKQANKQNKLHVDFSFNDLARPSRDPGSMGKAQTLVTVPWGSRPRMCASQSLGKWEMDDLISHRILVCYTYIYQRNQLNVCKYISPMDPMGIDSYGSTLIWVGEPWTSMEIGTPDRWSHDTWMIRWFFVLDSRESVVGEFGWLLSSSFITVLLKKLVEVLFGT